MHFLPGPLRCYARPGVVLLGTSFRNPRLQERLKIGAQDQGPAANSRQAKFSERRECVESGTGEPGNRHRVINAEGELFFQANMRRISRHLAISGWVRWSATIATIRAASGERNKRFHSPTSCTFSRAAHGDCDYSGP